MTKTLVLILALLLSLTMTLSAQRPEGSDPKIPKDTEIKKTASGLKYSVLTKGTGKVHPKWGDTVKVHYSGWLASTKKLFDSSVKRGKPAEFALGMVIEGWNEGLELMTVGSRFLFHIPAELGYGKRGNASIPPDSELIFEVELLGLTAGPELPSFPTFDAKVATTSENGMKSQALNAGTGDSCGTDDTLEIHYTFWNQKGEIVGSSRIQKKPMPLKG